jgi:hypothetical protein
MKKNIVIFLLVIFCLICLIFNFNKIKNLNIEKSALEKKINILEKKES